MRKEERSSLPFPLSGLDEDRSRKDQERGTTDFCQNVRAFDLEGRSRGGQRAGFNKYSTATVYGSSRVQCITHSITVNTSASQQSDNNNRTITLLAISNGQIKKMTPTAATPPGDTNTGILSTVAPVIFGSQFFDEVFFQDGLRHTVYDATNDVFAEVADDKDDEEHLDENAGTPPKTGSHTPRLCCTWRGRYVVSGIKTDPSNWHMSAVNNARDWNTAPTTLVETMAVSGNSADAGKIGDFVNCLLPYNNDLLWIGCDHSIWQLTGDPLVGGRFDLVSDTVGMAWGRPFCKDGMGKVYFMSSRGSIYSMSPGEPPQRITATKIEERMSSLDMKNELVTMAWDDEQMGVHIWISHMDGQRVSDNHWFYEARTDGWFPVRYDKPSHNPFAVHVFDGDGPEDRVILLGNEDGYIQKLDSQARDDDGTAIESIVRFGPIEVEGGRFPFLISGIQAVLDNDSSSVNYTISVGNSPEDANPPDAALFQPYLFQENLGKIVLDSIDGFLTQESNIAQATGTFTATRSTRKRPRRRGYAMYIDLTNTTVDQTWAIERLILDLTVLPNSKRGAL